jgi:hypothetical protein
MSYRAVAPPGMGAKRIALSPRHAAAWLTIDLKEVTA